MYIASIPNRNSPPAILLRESYRQNGKVRKRTLANLSHWPPARIEALRCVLRDRPVTGPLEGAFEIVRARPHGHVAATLGTLRRAGVEAVLGAKPTRQRALVAAMVVARVLEPASKLATARGLDDETLTSSLGQVLGLGDADADDLYEALDWLLARQQRIERVLAKKHLTDGALVLYDVTSTYFEGRTCPLTQRGYSRDGKRGTPQIVIGLLTNGEGCPVAVEVFDGNTADPKTLAAQIEKVRTRFGLKRVVLVGDRGMITEARIEQDLRGVEGLDWITALRAPAIKALVSGGTFQLSLSDRQDQGEIESPDYPGERLIVCKNPLLAQERARKREDLLAATERDLAKVAAATVRAKAPLRGKDKIGLKVGQVIGRYKMKKHFRLTIEDDAFRYERDSEAIAREAALDGIYVLRTSVPAATLPAAEVVRSYKRLAHVERAFRSLKTVTLDVRPIHHRKAEHVRAHVLLCMLGYYVEWHMRRALAPMLFADDDPQAGEALRASVVAPAQRSPRAKTKAETLHTPDGLPVHSFRTLLRDLATLTHNRVRASTKSGAEFDLIATPTPVQQRAFDLLEGSPRT